MLENTIQGLLYNAFEKYSDKIAIQYGCDTTTYGELNQRSNIIANHIISEGIARDSFIAILVDDRIELVTIMLGILKAGCVLVPLDSSYPVKRLETMITTTDIKHIFVDEANLDKVSGLSTTKTTVNSGLYDQGLTTHPEIVYTPEDMIYIFFTSGSTGTPKAIIGKNKSLLHFINWEIETFNIDETFCVSQLTSPSHDPILRDVLVPLCSGGMVCIPEKKEIILESNSLINWIEISNVNLVHCTPSLFRLLNLSNLSRDNLKSLKYVLMAGERINPQELVKWYDTFGERIQLVNLYGSTETTMVKLFYLINKEDTERKSIPAGRPMKGTRVIILDNDMNPCEQGEVGEIYIRTPYRTFGYYKNPELNSEKFIPNPFNNDPNDIIYKSGDLGRVLPDGNIEFLGRIDRQVKIRGIRIELGEIENTLLSHEGVQEVAVIDKEGSNGDLILCAYVVEAGLKKKELVSELREFLADKLPVYMIPQYITVLEKLPMTSSRKIDYKALPDPEIDSNNEYIAPRDEIEKKLEEIWCNILNIERVGIDENFMQIGGHSLNIMTLVSAIHQEFDVELPLAEVFNNATIEEIAKFIKTSQKSAYTSIESIEEKEYYELSSAQKRLYISSQLKHIGLSYNMPGIMMIEGSLDRQRVEGVFKTLVARHQAFRTSFAFKDGQIWQKIERDVDFKVSYVELKNTDEKEAVENIIKEFVQPFDLSKAPLLRSGLIRLSEDKHILMYDMHHIISDGSSMAILEREFIKLYNGQSLPQLKIQYKDFASWHNNLLQSSSYKKQEEYWLNRFAGEIPILNMPTDFERPSVQSFEGDLITFTLSKELTANLKKLARDTGSTVYMTLMAVYNILLSKYTGQEDIVMGSTIEGRHHADLENIIGMFVNILPLRNYPKGSKTFKAFLNEVKRNALEAYDNQDYQFDDFIDKLKINRDFSRNPICDTVFDMQNLDTQTVDTKELKFKPYEFSSRSTKFDITLGALEIDEEIQFYLEYCSRLFKKETMCKLADHFRGIVREIIINPDVVLSEIPMLTEEEKKLLLLELKGDKETFEDIIPSEALEAEFEF